MIVNTPALDYYRATTWNFNRYDDTVKELVSMVKQTDKAKWSFQQYKGDMYGSIAHGQAIQSNGDMSYIVDISGEASDDNFDLLIYSDMKPTRIDVQYTIPKPAFWDSAEFYFEMQYGVWQGVPRDVQARLNKGNDTIYIGDRTSDRYVRVYVKEQDFIRFEVEFKRERAANALKIIKAGRRYAMAGILLAECEKLPQCPFTRLLGAELERHNKQRVSVTVERVKSTDLRRVKWLASLLPTIFRMMNDSDYGPMVTGWFIDMVERRINSEQDGI